MIRPTQIIEYGLFNMLAIKSRKFIFSNLNIPGLSDVMLLKFEYPFFRISNFRIECESELYDVFVNSRNNSIISSDTELFYSDIDTKNLSDDSLNLMILHDEIELCSDLYKRNREVVDKDLYLTINNKGSININNVIVKITYELFSTPASMLIDKTKTGLKDC